eukprot:Amastigsp_a676751_23.p3 type:complete len:213 gc:universal Amastigsp_a676751_23:1226-1864(+)
MCVRVCAPVLGEDVRGMRKLHRSSNHEREQSPCVEHKDSERDACRVCDATKGDQGKEYDDPEGGVPDLDRRDKVLEIRHGRSGRDDGRRDVRETREARRQGGDRLGSCVEKQRVRAAVERERCADLGIHSAEPVEHDGDEGKRDGGPAPGGCRRDAGGVEARRCDVVGANRGGEPLAKLLMVRRIHVFGGHGRLDGAHGALVDVPRALEVVV